MPYGIPEEKGGDSKENIKKMEKCIGGIDGINKKTGKPYTEGEKIAICKTQLFGSEKDKKEMSNKINGYIFSEIENKEYKTGEEVKIQILKIGKRRHPEYGEVIINEKVMNDIISNFENRERGIDLAVDENHEPDHKALGWFRRLYKEGKDKLYAIIELTKEGAEKLTQGLYKYFSPEMILGNYKDEETGKKINNILLGGAFTNRPFFKNMEGILPISASEPSSQDINKYILYPNLNNMEEYTKLFAQFVEKDKLSEQEIEQITQKFNELNVEDRNTNLETFEKLISKGFNEKKKEEEIIEEVKGNGGTTITNEEIIETEIDGIKMESKEKITISANEYSELKNVQKIVCKLQKEARVRDLQDKFSTYTFSENNSKGMILPKDKNEFINFVLSLSEPLETKFFSLLKKLTTLELKEIGHGEDIEPKTAEQVELELIEKAKIIAKEKNITLAQALKKI